MKTILVDAWNTLVVEGEGVSKSLFELLETYPNRKIVLTNANEEKQKELGLDAVPYEMFTLGNNPPKTDPSYFEKMLAHFGLTTADVMYFEHNAEAVKSAQSAGITAYHFDHEKRDLAALKTYLDANL